jgi:hypothetical protein
MGALVGGGSEEQIEAVGRYYESIGIAFQIMDDVLNLRGLYTGKADEGQEKKELKNLGEDITSGKVTIPVVKAIKRLPRDKMRAMWGVIKTKPRDRPTIARVIAELEDCGALDECVEQSERLVEDAYAKLDAVIPDSFSKCVPQPPSHPPFILPSLIFHSLSISLSLFRLMLRSFGFFVTEQSVTRARELELRREREAAKVREK